MKGVFPAGLPDAGSAAVRLAFEGHYSRAVLFDAGLPNLLVTFDHYHTRRDGFAVCRRSPMFARHGYANLRIQSAANDWFINPDLEELEDILASLTLVYRKIVCLGFSMGGYAALRLASSLNADQLIAVSPQSSLTAPFETRFRREAILFNETVGDLAGNGLNDLKGALVFDPLHPQDRAHVRAISQHFPSLDLAPLAGGGHPANRVLRDAGPRAALQMIAMQKDCNARDIVALHRRVRRQSPAYWLRIARLSRKRRPALAAAADGEYKRLSG